MDNMVIKVPNPTPVHPDSELTSNHPSNESNLPVDPRILTISIELEGNCPEGTWDMAVFLLKQTVMENPWIDPQNLSVAWDCDVSLPDVMAALVDEPLVVVLRPSPNGNIPSGLNSFINIDRAAAGTMDLLPIFIGEDCISEKVKLVNMETGENIGCSVHVRIEANKSCPAMIAVRITLLRSACLPVGKTENMYLGALSMSRLDLPSSILYFGPSSNEVSGNSVWVSLLPLKSASASNYPKKEDDIFVDSDLKGTDFNECNTTEWNSCRRILVDYDLLKQRLDFPFIMEIAGLPRVGKPELRGQYMTFVDAGVLLEPGECAVTIRVPLRKYEATLLPEETPPMLDLPTPNLYSIPNMAETVELETINDENGHPSYVEIRFETSEPINPLPQSTELHEILENEVKVESEPIVDLLIPSPLPPRRPMDFKIVISNCEALTLHNELDAASLKRISGQKRPAIAAKRLLDSTKELLQEHHPGECSKLEMYDIISGQHFFARRAVTAALAPKPPPLRAPALVAAARAKLTGDMRLAESSLSKSLIVYPNNPRHLLSLALRRLENHDRRSALDALQSAFHKQPNNRYILWTMAALESSRGQKGMRKAEAAFYLAITNDASLNGTRRVVGWAALHAHYHTSGQTHAAFVAARNMRKAAELPADWDTFLKHWQVTTGEEEHQWDPRCISDKHPLLMAAAFFLSLRSFNFVDQLLHCSERGCGELGCKKIHHDTTKFGPEALYLRASLSLLRGRLESALHHINKSVQRYGPGCCTSRLKVACLLAARSDWDDECEAALEEAESCGALDSAHLLHAALAEKRDPSICLQRAARAHKNTPSAQSALVIARLKWQLGRSRSAERWAAAAVAHEPDLADGWAELSRQLLTQRKTKAARAALRTARQAGPVSQYLLEEIKLLSTEIVGMFGLPEMITDDLCICNPGIC